MITLRTMIKPYLRYRAHLMQWETVLLALGSFRISWQRIGMDLRSHRSTAKSRVESTIPLPPVCHSHYERSDRYMHLSTVPEHMQHQTRCLKKCPTSNCMHGMIQTEAWLHHRGTLWNVSVSKQCKHYKKNLQHLITLVGMYCQGFWSLNRYFRKKT